MKIHWIEDMDELDNVAYSIYYNFEMERQKYYSDTLILNPSTFIHFKQEHKKIYDKAKIELRRMKIEKLINENR